MSAETMKVEQKDIDAFTASLYRHATPWHDGCARLIEKLWRELTAAQAELAALRKDAEGMVMVPREPTPEMLEPFARLICTARGIDPDVQNSPDWPAWYPFCQEANECYKAMLAAS